MVAPAQERDPELRFNQSHARSIDAGWPEAAAYSFQFVHVRAPDWRVPNDFREVAALERSAEEPTHDWQAAAK